MIGHAVCAFTLPGGFSRNSERLDMRTVIFPVRQIDGEHAGLNRTAFGLLCPKVTILCPKVTVSEPDL